MTAISVDPRAFQIVSLAKGLEMYAKTGIMPNRLWTPKNMMATATKLTGQKFRAREYSKAATALRALLEPVVTVKLVEG